MKLLLVGNYSPDRQQSMRRFSGLLEREGRRRGWDVSVTEPEPSFLTRRVRPSQGWGKWLGYWDKYLRFPGRLKRRIAETAEGTSRDVVVHIVDHSNSVYVPAARQAGSPPWVVTCHDLLAVRGALGEDTDCPASTLGRRLQRAIVRGLGRAAAIPCDSTSTFQDAQRIVPAPPGQLRRVIFLALSHPYRAVGNTVARGRLAALPGIPWERPFLIHVGSNLSRKNKAGAVRVLARLRERWPGNLVFCGESLPTELRAQAIAAGLGDRVFAIPAPDNMALEAAYACAHALLFPSRCEGFGWPVIEAQACGCPVVCSDRTSLPEVGGDAALVHALEDETGMAESILRLCDPCFRAVVVARGFANLERFATEGMVDAYAQLYDEVLAASAPP